jgi:integrase/recombinase XerC
MYLSHIAGIVQPETARQRRYHLESLMRFVGPDVALKGIKTKHLQDWVVGQNMRASSVHLRFGTIRYFYADALRHNWVKIDPTREVLLPRRASRKPRALPGAEINALGAALPDERARLIMALAINEGLRRVEICRLEHDDFDFEAMTFRVVTAKSWTEDTLPLTIDTHQNFLLPYLVVRGTAAGPLIQSYTTGEALKPTSLTNMVNRWFCDAGIKTGAYDGRSLHAGRHSCASQMLDAGAPITVVQKYLRHRNMSSTYVYAGMARDVEEMRPWADRHTDA